MSLVGKTCPNFTAPVVRPDGSHETIDFHQDRDGRYAVILFYPFDFTFVCPTEIIEFSRTVPSLKDTAVYAISVDSQFTHSKYRDTAIEDGGIGPVNCNLVADCNHDIMYKFGVACADRTHALRGTFILDREGMVVSQTINCEPLGRNISEIPRLLEAQKHFEQHGEVCPANWNPGSDAMKPNAEGVKDYLSTHKAGSAETA